MREYRKSIQRFRMYPGETEGRGVQFLDDLYNIRPQKIGGVGYVGLTDPLTQTSSWPFPQAHFGREIGLLLGSGTVSTFNSSYMISPLDTVTGSVLWDVADFGSYLVLSNGLHTYHTTGTTLTLADTPGLMSVCNYNGQLIGGGVQTSWYDCGAESVIWARPGQGLGETNTPFALDRHNLSGYYADPGLGTIYRVLPVEAGFLALGKKGVALFFFTEEGRFGMRQLPVPGVAWKGSACSDGKRVLMLGTDGRLYLTDGRQAEMLGYKPLMSALSYPIITYDHINRDFHIASATTGYALSEDGLYRCYQSPTSIGNWAGNRLGLFVASADTYASARSLPQDFGSRWKKSLSGILVGVSASNNGHSRYHYRYGQGSYGQTPYIPLSPQGLSRTTVTADDIKAEIKFTSPTNLKLDYMAFLFKGSWLMSNERIDDADQTNAESDQ